MSDDYDVLPLPVKLGSIKNKHDSLIKPFVGVYFPIDLLDKMGWTKDTKLTLTVEKDGLKIYKAAEDREPFFFTNELIYDLENED